MEIKDLRVLVDDFLNTTRVRATEGEAYYRGKNIVITERQKMYYNSSNSRATEDPYRANNKLASRFIKLLIDQKVNYSVNGKLKVTNDDSGTIS